MPEEAVLDTPAIDAPEIDAPDTELETPDAPEGELEVPETPEESSDEPADDEPEVEGEQEQVTADGRKMPDALKKGIAAIKATNPEAAKLIKGMFFADQEYRAVFPKPADAVAAKELIETVGGAEGLQEIQAERDEWNAIDTNFLEKPDQFVKDLAESSTDSFLKVVPHAINEFASRAPEQYSYYANTVALNTLKNAGIDIPALASAYQRYSDKPEAQAIIAEVHNALLGLKQKATEFEQKRSDPREDALKQRETAFEQKRRADFEGGVASQAEKFLSEKMQPAIDRIINGRKVDPDAMKGYQKMVDDEVKRMLAEVPGFEAKLEANYRTGDAKRSVDFITAQYNRILPQAAKVIEPFLRNIAGGKPAPKPQTNGKPAPAGEIVLREMPDWNDVDQSKTTVADLIEGHAILKSGKKASGWA